MYEIFYLFYLVLKFIKNLFSLFKIYIEKMFIFKILDRNIKIYYKVIIYIIILYYEAFLYLLVKNKIERGKIDNSSTGRRQSKDRNEAKKKRCLSGRDRVPRSERYCSFSVGEMLREMLYNPPSIPVARERRIKRLREQIRDHGSESTIGRTDQR